MIGPHRCTGAILNKTNPKWKNNNNEKQPRLSALLLISYQEYKFTFFVLCNRPYIVHLLQYNRNSTSSSRTLTIISCIKLIQHYWATEHPTWAQWRLKHSFMWCTMPWTPSIGICILFCPGNCFRCRVRVSLACKHWQWQSKIQSPTMCIFANNGNIEQSLTKKWHWRMIPQK